MNKKTKKTLTGQVRVDPIDQGKAVEITQKWRSLFPGNLSMKDIFRAGVRVFEQKIKPALKGE